MADEHKNPTPTIEVDSGPSTNTTADIHADGTSTLRTQVDSMSVDIGAKELGDNESLDDVEGKELEGEPPSTAPADAEDVSTEDPTDGGEDTAGSDEPLPDFDFDSEEVVSKYDAKYTTTDEAGDTVINLNAFNDEIAANYKDGKTDLNAGSRAYLKKAFGVSDALIDRHLAGLVADAQKYDGEVYSKFGSEQDYGAAIEWSRGEGGYSKAQTEKYNAAIQKYHKTGDRSDLDDQIDLLAARYKSATGKTTSDSSKGGKSFRDRRPSSPPRQATKTTVKTDGPALFANSEEHRLAQAEAHKSGDPKKMKDVSDRLRLSMQKPGWA